MKRLCYVLTILATSAVSVSSVHAEGQFGAWPPVDVIAQHVKADDRQAAGEGIHFEPATIDLYLKPDEADRSVEPVGPEVDRDLHDIEREARKANAADPEAYPSLYRRQARDGLIVIFGFPTCAPCHMQNAVIPKGYRVLRVDKDSRDTIDGPTWRALMKKWDIDQRFLNQPVPIYPTTVIVEKGVPTKVFYAYKPWRLIKPHAQKAKKADEKSNTSSRRRYRNRLIDFSRNRAHGRQRILFGGRWSR